MTTPPEAPSPWRPLSSTELAERQLAAIDRWHRAAQASTQTAALIDRTREARLDRDRALSVMRREHDAIVAATAQQLRDSATVLRSRAERRAVLVHRDGWFRDRVCAVLEEHGVHVVARLEDGATAVGACVAEQPDLLLVEDSLPSLSGAQVVRRVGEFSPLTVCGAHVGHDAAVAVLLDAGARTAWTRRVPPGDVGLGLCRLVDA